MRICYVAADPRRVNMLALRQLLEEEELELRLFTDVPSPDQDASTVSRSVIDAASVVLGILVGGSSDRNVLYELGIASALGKPIVLWVDNEAEVPSDLRTLPTIKFAPEAPESLRFALRHATRARQEHRIEQVEPPRRPQIREIERNHENLTSWLAGLVKEEGGTSIEGRPGGADLVLWLPDLERSVGNPFVIEVKYSLETERAFESAVEQVLRQIRATGGHWGMVVYRKGPPGRAIKSAHLWPTVLALREDELAEMLEAGNFADVVRRVRNERAHEVR